MSASQNCWAHCYLGVGHLNTIKYPQRFDTFGHAMTKIDPPDKPTGNETGRSRETHKVSLTHSSLVRFRNEINETLINAFVVGGGQEFDRQHRSQFDDSRTETQPCFGLPLLGSNVSACRWRLLAPSKTLSTVMNSLKESSPSTYQPPGRSTS